MNHFKAPTSSESSFSGPSMAIEHPATRIEPKKVLNKAKPGNANRRTRPGAGPDVRELLMKKARRERLQVKHRTGSHVYVGNLSSEASEADIEGLFSTCGDIESVIISRTSHCLENVDPKDETSNGANYAHIRFLTRLASRNALMKTGTLLHGSRVMVCLAAMDLPEVARMVERTRHLLDRDGDIFTPGVTLQATVQLNSPSWYEVQERVVKPSRRLESGNIASSIEASGGMSEWLS